MSETDHPVQDDAEARRLAEADAGDKAWRRWGPYLSERQWGTVREDYSADGDAWAYFPHDHARSRAYRWGEDGLAGLSDDRQYLCLSLALWNGKDAILKERLFGLTNPEGNHGEDVKELYYYVDATPTHAYLRTLYKYPQAAFPYQQLLDENRRRGRDVPEYELVDTGVFAGGRFFDVTVDYAKQDTDDILMRVTVANRGPEPATLHLLPQLWFRNIWSWRTDPPPRPRLDPGETPGTLRGHHPWLGRIRFEAMGGAAGEPEFLFCDNDTNLVRHDGAPEGTPGVWKDGFHDAVVHGKAAAVSRTGPGTKAAAHWVLTVAPGAEQQVVVRLSVAGVAVAGEADAFEVEPVDADALFRTRRAEADHFYAAVQSAVPDPDARLVQRQALSGMIWGKQLYRYDVRRWLEGDAPAQPAPPGERLARSARNTRWGHLNAIDVLSMPDKWEYPWFASWDLALQCLPLALIDPAFAKGQLLLLTREWYMHPNGQLPAYEWSFDDVNPPVHAWAAWRVFEIDREKRGDAVGDIGFLERVFHKLLMNFTWWVNREDASGLNIFQGGFLGMDNIGVFNRSEALPGGARINQADGTAWMAMYSLNMLRIALELGSHDTAYEDIASKFFEHFLLIAEAMTTMAGGGGLWDEEDGFFYDKLELPDGRIEPLKLRSAVGLVPLFAVEVIEPGLLDRLPDFARRLRWVLKHRPDLAALVSRWQVKGSDDRRLLSLLRGHRMKRLLSRMLDEEEFLSPYGIRSLSKRYAADAYRFETEGTSGTLSATYTPGESDTGLFGGNSNWRGPIWFPINHLIIESLRRFHAYYGDDFLVECPTGSGRFLTLRGVADELSSRLVRLFLRDSKGVRPALGEHGSGQGGPMADELLLFHEYFHGETGQGLGASHQTGWTGLVATLIAMGHKP